MKITLLAGDSGARIGALGALWRIMMDDVRWCVDCRWTRGIRASKSIFVGEKHSGLMSILRSWLIKKCISYWNTILPSIRACPVRAGRKRMHGRRLRWTTQNPTVDLIRGATNHEIECFGCFHSGLQALNVQNFRPPSAAIGQQNIPKFGGIWGFP